MAYDPFAELMAMNPKKDMADAEAAEAAAKVKEASQVGAKAFAKFLQEARAGTAPPLSAKKPEDTDGVYEVKVPSSGFSFVKVKQPDGTSLIVLENIQTGLVTNLTGFTSVKFSDGKDVDLATFSSIAGDGDVRAFNGGEGSDSVKGREGITDILLGNAGDDEFSMFSSLDLVDGGEGEDAISLSLPASAYSVMQSQDEYGNITYMIAWMETGADGQQKAASITASNIEIVKFETGGGQDGKSPLTMTMQEFAAQRAYRG